MSASLAATNPRNLPFQQVVTRANEIVIAAVKMEWSQIKDLNELSDPVYLKNAEGVIVEANTAYLDIFSPDGSPFGRSGSAFLDETIRDVSKQSDSLILSGSSHLECEHVGRSGDGMLYLIRTHKRSLAELGAPGLAILGVSRLERRLEEAGAHPRVKLSEQHARFRQLNETDREICRLLGRGKKVREIAESLNLTSRSVEQHKRKILDTLDLDQSLDLIKLLVRLQDGGFIDFGM